MNTTQINSILAGFCIPKKDYTFSPLTQGLINDTFLIQDQQTPVFILQRINHSIFKNVAGLMGNISKSLAVLDGKGYQKISLVSSNDGMPYAQIEGDYWRIMDFIPQSTAYDSSTDLPIAKEAGRIIGTFHELMLAKDISEFTETIAKFQDMEWRAEEFKEALQNTSPEKIDQAKSAISFAKKMLPLVTDPKLKLLPKRLCHNDTKLNNILFSKTTNKALCMIDLDTLMPGLFLYDFGDAIRTIVNPIPENSTDYDAITFDKELFTAFIDGLAPHISFLTKEEKETMALGAVYMPFIHGLRALTDFLNNNTYYKVSYENQNLDRCTNLFTFTNAAFENLDFMNALVIEKLTLNS